MLEGAAASDNLEFMLCFLGEKDKARIGELCDAMKADGVDETVVEGLRKKFEVN